ncbi:MAG: alpha/beta fold hydrolase [Deltaproteobacteria bacterium]|nr:alpha/beta fold hydrolase [Deltaproteobacteria bacterium]
MKRLAKHLLLAIVYALLGSFVFATVLYIKKLNAQPDLQPWHVVDLEEEFRASRSDEINDFDAYLALEDRLFAELQRKVYTEPEDPERGVFNRFRSGSRSDPAGQPINWNRSFELRVEEPRAGFLMLHGLTDSPYSMRALAERLHARGVWVLGLRVPGHGTAPAALADSSWKDFVAATRLGANHLHGVLGPDRPFYIAGYSNGAALAVEYALEAMEDDALPQPDGLLLLSPAIGLSKLAAFASVQARVARLPSFEKVGWTSILPEFDPYKYNSFPVNAGDQIYRLTLMIGKRILRLGGPAGVADFPPTLAFQSLVDSTVPPTTIVQQLLAQLEPNGHELVVFDVNRRAAAEDFLISDPTLVERHLLSNPELPFAVTMVTNESPDSLSVVALRKPARSNEVTREPLGLSWPANVFSLSHVAIPFAPDDPLYGVDAAESEVPLLSLGRFEPRGESGVLVVSAGYFARLRHNPFFDYMAGRIVDTYAPAPIASP